VVAVAAIALPGQAQNLVSNGSFDTDVAGWAVKAGQAEISWDGMNGYPAPGSLRFSSAESDSVFEAVSPCIETVDNEILTAAGRVLEPEGMPPGVSCYITITLYVDADCAGSRTFTGNVPPNNPGVWEESGFVFDVRTVPSVEVALTLVVNTSAVGEKYCLFDSVTLTSDSRAPSIPALSGSGVLVLCLVLSACGVAAMTLSRARRAATSRKET
jgi:hypothetical protein